ncbi:MAG: DUF177 domain-containing protein [Vicingaceae bacterium]|nr:DUF177 domain-containing protein [Vicingaceae bacterium]
MRALSDFIIKFEGLKQGTHFYEFDVDTKFFEEFDCFEFDKATINVDLEFEKQSTMMLLNFDFYGTVTVPCDRCLDEVDVDIEGEEKLILKFGSESYQETEEIIILPDSAFEINLAANIYEFIMVNIPQKRVHDEGLCNQDVISELEKIEEKEDNEIDPRWSTLKDINIKK